MFLSICISIYGRLPKLNRFLLLPLFELRFHAFDQSFLLMRTNLCIFTQLLDKFFVRCSLRTRLVACGCTQPAPLMPATLTASPRLGFHRRVRDRLTKLLSRSPRNTGTSVAGSRTLRRCEQQGTLASLDQAGKRGVSSTSGVGGRCVSTFWRRRRTPDPPCAMVSRGTRIGHNWTKGGRPCVCDAFRMRLHAFGNCIFK